MEQLASDDGMATRGLSVFVTLRTITDKASSRGRMKKPSLPHPDPSSLPPTMGGACNCSTAPRGSCCHPPRTPVGWQRGVAVGETCCYGRMSASNVRGRRVLARSGEVVHYRGHLCPMPLTHFGSPGFALSCVNNDWRVLNETCTS